jgi:hypothetical protein
MDDALLTRVDACGVAEEVYDTAGGVDPESIQLENVPAERVQGSWAPPRRGGGASLSNWSPTVTLLSDAMLTECKFNQVRSTIKTHASMIGGPFGTLSVGYQKQDVMHHKFAELLRDGALLFFTEFIGAIHVEPVTFVQRLIQKGDAVSRLVIDFDKCRLPVEECVRAGTVLSWLIRQCLRPTALDTDLERNTSVYISIPHWMVSSDASTDGVQPYTGNGRSYPEYYPKNKRAVGGNLHLHGPPMTRHEVQVLAGKLVHVMLTSSLFPVFNAHVEELRTTYSLSPTDLLGAIAFNASKNAALNIVDHGITGCRLPFVPKSANNRTELVPVCYAVICKSYISDSGVPVVDSRSHTGSINPKTRRVHDGYWYTSIVNTSIQVPPGTLSVVDEARVAAVCNLGISIPSGVFVRSALEPSGDKKRKWNTLMEPDLTGNYLRKWGRDPYVMNLDETLRRLGGDIPPLLKTDADRLVKGDNLTNLLGEVNDMINAVHQRIVGKGATEHNVRAIYVCTDDWLKQPPNDKRPPLLLTLKTVIPKACPYKNVGRGAEHSSNHQKIEVYFNEKKKKWTAQYRCHNATCAKRAANPKYRTPLNSVELSDDAAQEVIKFLTPKFGIETVDPQQPMRILKSSCDRDDLLRALLERRDMSAETRLPAYHHLRVV